MLAIRVPIPHELVTPLLIISGILFVILVIAALRETKRDWRPKHLHYRCSCGGEWMVKYDGVGMQNQFKQHLELGSIINELSRCPRCDRSWAAYRTEYLNESPKPQATWVSTPETTGGEAGPEHRARNRKDAGAIADSAKAIEIDPQDAEAYYNRGIAHAKASDYGRAIADFTRAIEIAPWNGRAYCARGAVYSWMGDYNRAIADSSMAVEINPQDAVAYNNRGDAYCRKGDYNRALTNYTKAIGIKPHDAEYCLGRGLIYARMGDHSRAILDYAKAIEINPHYAGAYYARGATYETQGRGVEAVQDYRRALESDPKHQRARDALKRLGGSP